MEEIGGIVSGDLTKSINKLMDYYRDETLSDMISKVSAEGVMVDERGQYDWTVQGQRLEPKLESRFKPRSKEFMKK